MIRAKGAKREREMDTETRRKAAEESKETCLGSNPGTTTKDKSLVLVCRYQKLGSLNNRNLTPPSSGGNIKIKIDIRFKIKVLERMVPSEAMREESVPGLTRWFVDGHLPVHMASSM